MPKHNAFITEQFNDERSLYEFYIKIALAGAFRKMRRCFLV